eukprot:CAMPEP_0172194110 /NCGR_PEP_ID=MMETSP1050-20130122/25372_1 /TAXON_ID=233186 /ORGANISM="Cryptomonas curvata, Strain CCAP979/52" /LENGTH=143 /DNA_ID=CAMNT_0012869829 /DNA_START=162 /DNA_END=590 /DNA_ORIENTATION=-
MSENDELRIFHANLDVEDSDTSCCASMACLFDYRASRKKFASNTIRTTKYSLLTFFPLNLFDQLSRMFNIFWLIQSVVSLIPRLSPSTPETTVSGFAFIVLVSMAKDAYEDYMRHRSDSACNRTLVSVWRDGAFVQVASRSVR